MEKKSKGIGTQIGRRNILKMMSMIPAAALVPVTPFASAAAMGQTQEEAAQSGAEQGGSGGYQPKVFNPHEWRTVTILSDLILPADERSCSASEAGVPEFIDNWLSVKRGNLSDEIRGGLTWLDMASNRSFQYDFADCSAGQQKQILDRIAFPKKAAPEDASAAAFFNDLRDLVVSGYFTSRMGIRELPYLGNQPQSAWHGCPEEVMAKLEVGKFSRNA